MLAVLFVNPPTPGFRKITRNVDCASESKGNYLLQPFDFLFLSGTLSSGTELRFVDAVADRLDADACIARIMSAPFDLIIASIVDRTWEEDFSFLSRLRGLRPNTPILVFGDALIEDDNAAAVERIADGIILSPYTFNPSAVTDWSREGVRAKKAELGLRGQSAAPVQKKPRPARPLHPRHELFLHPSYRWPFASHKRYTTVTIVWGCPYSCSYCTCAQLPAISRSADEILDELSRIKRLGIKEVYFGDKSFGALRGVTVAVLEGLLQRELGFSWSAYFHPNQYDPELLELMRRSGCHTIIVGIESANLSSLARYKRNVNSQKIEALLAHASRIGLNVCGDFLLGLPDEDEKAISETIAYSLKLKLDYASFNIASPLPGSVIKSAAIQDGRMTTLDHHFDSVGKDRILPSNLLGSQELARLRSQAVKRFYLRPRYLLKRITRLRGLEHLRIQMAEMIELLRKAR